MGGKGTGSKNVWERLERIDVMLYMYKNNIKWRRERLIAEFQAKYGVARRTAIDYLKVLENTNKVHWPKDQRV